MDDNLFLLILLLIVLFGIYYYQDLIIPKILTTFGKNKEKKENKENKENKTDKVSKDSDKIKTEPALIVSSVHSSVFDEPKEDNNVISFDEDSNNSFGESMFDEENI
jgi:hypothetical protein